MTHAPTITRREFAAIAAAAPLALGSRSTGIAGLTAAAVIARIRERIGVEWKPDTVDTIKAGDPATVVTGIVTTALASVAVLRQAVDAGANLVIAAEPTFFSRTDAREPAAGRADAASAPPRDPVFAAKNELIARHRLVVFRLRDHWRLRRPDPLAQGLGEALGWSNHAIAGDPSRYAIPAVTLAALVAHTKQRLDARGGVRVIGEPAVTVRTVALLPGSTPLSASLAALPDADVVVAGEVREWESTEYARDVVDAGQRKGLVLVGRILSEEPGMRICASWLKTLVPEVAVRHVAAGDPYWRPA